MNGMQINEFQIKPAEIRFSTHVLKDDDLFLNFLADGSVPLKNKSGFGLYCRDTRFLDGWEMRINRTRPLLLSSSSHMGYLSRIDLTNKELESDGMSIPPATIHLRLLNVLRGALLQRIRLLNFNDFCARITLEFDFSADFADIFEVRGTERRKRGQVFEPEITTNGVLFSYRGLDNLVYKTAVTFSPAPEQIVFVPGGISARFDLELPPRRKRYLLITIVPGAGGESGAPGNFEYAARRQRESYREWQFACTKFRSDHELYNAILMQGIVDLRALQKSTPSGPILPAGIPWFASPFGRDAIISSFQALPVNPELARSTLRFLARYQGSRLDRWREEEPGKIMHELRYGEMANCHEIPHTPYYGSIDATPLFVVLLSETCRWTNDIGLLREMAGPLREALRWMDEYGDLDKDGYVEYIKKSPGGLSNQGWKDSWNAVVDESGEFVSPPIAPVEVQGYVFDAKQRASELLFCLGEEHEAGRLRREAEELKRRFLKDFWLGDRLAFALDGLKQPVATMVSNMGHCLFSGILDDERAGSVAERLFEPDMFSGWGIRTMGKNERAYNPMSYHNGSVWPHENSIISWGLKRYGFEEKAGLLATKFFEAAGFFDCCRLPELFCGFTRRAYGGPVRHILSCSFQSWSVGSTFLFLRSLTGIEPHFNEVYIDPVLPVWLNRIKIRDLAVGGGVLDIEFFRKNGETAYRVLRREGRFEVIHRENR